MCDSPSDLTCKIMANYANILAEIAAAIYTNDSEEITGAVLQTVLLDMVPALSVGYEFRGIASPETDPGIVDAKIWYIGPSGTYTNFGASQGSPFIVEDGKIAVFTYDTTWHRDKMEITTALEIVNNLEDGGVDKALSAQQGVVLQGEIDDMNRALGNISAETQDITSQFSIPAGQAYGTVGSAISTNDDTAFEHVKIPSAQLTRFVTFRTKAGDSANVSSYIQFVNSSDVVQRLMYTIGNYQEGVQYTQRLVFQGDEVAAYVTGVTGSISIREETGETRTVEERLNYLEDHETEIVNNLDDGGVDKALSAQQGVVLGNYVLRRQTGAVTNQTEVLVLPQIGYQAYGSVGGTIQTGQLVNYSYVKILVSGLKISFNTGQNNTISSLIQYVDEHDVIVSRDAVGAPTETVLNRTLDFPTGVAAVFVTFANGSLIIENAPLLDATSLGNNFVNAGPSTVGNRVSLDSSATALAIRIDVSRTTDIQYPCFASASNYGTVITDANNIVLAAFVSDYDGMRAIQVSDYTGAKWLYCSIFPKTGRVYPFNYDGPGWVQPQLLSDNYNEPIDYKGLSLKGAYELRKELKGGGGAERPFFTFRDFGTMPSCLLSEPPYFLGDGLISSAEAIIKYSDVVAKYDALVSAYPGYVSKTALGYDASGTIMIYSYTFASKYWKQSVYLQAGVHGWEPAGVYGLAEIMYLIANAYSPSATLYVDDDALRWLRQNVKFTVVPCVNPWGFNNRGDCAMDKRDVAQNNYNGVQLNGTWNSNEPENVYVRNILTALKDELSYSIDMHSTVWPDSRTRYGCFYGGYNANAVNVMSLMRTWQALYSYYNVKYPAIVQGDTAPHPFDSTYASIGKMSNVFSSWCLYTFAVQSVTIEFSDHVWSQDINTSVAMSVAVNMYLNHIIGQICEVYKFGGVSELPAEDVYNAKG